jgi:hypothetical protein
VRDRVFVWDRVSDPVSPSEARSFAGVRYGTQVKVRRLGSRTGSCTRCGVRRDRRTRGSLARHRHCHRRGSRVIPAAEAIGLPAMRRPAPLACSARKEVIVKTNRRIGAAIALSTATLATAGLLLGFFARTPAVGLAVVGIVIGTGVARGAFSATDGSQRH